MDCVRARPVVVLTALLTALLSSACSGGSDGSPTSLSSQSSAASAPSAAPGGPASAGPPAQSSAADWPGYHRDQGRTGYDPGAPAVGSPSRAWRADTDGAVYASPLVVGGVVIAATERNTVYGLDLRSGRQLWSTNLGEPVPLSDLPCGNIDPLGITGTPVYDPATRTVLAVNTIADGRRTRHLLVGLDPTNGEIRGSVKADPPGQDPTVENQRGALAIVGNQVLVPYGGHAGDCGDFYGYVVGLTTDYSGAMTTYRAGTKGEAGIWAPSGVAVDAAGFAYAASGNGRVTSGNAYDESDAVVKLDPARGLAKVDGFTETGWAKANAGDVDLGSTGPLLVGDQIWQQGKSSKSYLQPQVGLGGFVGTPVTTSACASQFGGAAAHGSTIFAACTDGVRQVEVLPTGGVRLGWKADSSITGSPVVGGGAVWSLDVEAGRLHALEEATGRSLAAVDVGEVTRFATPALSGGFALVPTKQGITAVRSS